MNFENINNCPQHEYNSIQMVCETCKTLFCKTCSRVHPHPKHKIFIFETSLFKNYHFMNYLGSGSFGKVFSVIDLSDGRSYALKMIENVNDQNSKSILQELEIHKGLLHPNIIGFHSFEYLSQNNEDRMAIFLELADNSLKGIIKDITQEEAFHYFVDICKGIDFLHNQCEKTIICLNLDIEQRFDTKELLHLVANSVKF